LENKVENTRFKWKLPMKFKKSFKVLKIWKLKFNQIYKTLKKISNSTLPWTRSISAIFNFSSLSSVLLTRVVPSLPLAIDAQQPLSWNLSRAVVTPLSRREAARREKSHEQVSVDSNSVAQSYWRGLGLAEIDLVHGKWQG